MKYLIVYLKDVTKEEAIKMAKSYLPIKPSQLNDVDRLLVLLNKKYIAEYSINNNVIFNSEDLKTKLELSIINNSNFINKQTSYPFNSFLTIKNLSDLLQSLD